MKLLFAKPQAIEEEIGLMEKDAANQREDRALVSSFFNGSPPISDEEAHELGITVNVNHLFGYTDLSIAGDQMFSTFTKPTHNFTVEIRHARPGKAMEWSLGAQAAASRVLRNIRSFRTHYQGVTGDATLHGEGVFHFTSRTFPTPKQAPLSKLLIPGDASTDTSELTHCAREGEIGLTKLHAIAEAAKAGRRPEGWKIATVNRLLAKLYADDPENGAAGLTEDGFDADNLEEMEYRRQQNSAGGSRRKTSWKVYYFYQKRCDLKSGAIACTIILKSTEDDSPNGADAESRVLYESDECYCGWSEILHPVFMDCIIGGEPKWKRVLGLGHLNYSLNQTIELLICRAQQATMEGSMNLWQASNDVSREEMQQILLRHNGIVPPGMELMPNRFAPNFSGILEMIQFYRQQSGKNIRGVTPNNGDSNDQLEVQAQFEMQQSASNSNNRSTNFYDCVDPMWEQVWARLTNPFIDSDEDGFSEVMDFQAEISSLGISLYDLQPHNVEIRATRLVGDGLRSKELSIASFLASNRQMFVPEVQPRITRLITSIALDNHRLAEDLTPIDESNDDPQAMRAQAENSAMITQRAPQKPKADDIDAIHIINHFPAMEVLLSDATQYQQAAFTPMQAQAFQTIGAHIHTHIQRIEGMALNQKNDGNRQMARQFMEQLTQLAAMGDKMVHNMQQKQQQGEQEQMDPGEMAKLQLDIQKLQFNREKLSVTAQQKDRQMDLKEQQAAFDQNLRMGEDWRSAREHRQGLALNDLNAALQISDANSNDGAET